MSYRQLVSAGMSLTLRSATRARRREAHQHAAVKFQIIWWSAIAKVTSNAINFERYATRRLASIISMQFYDAHVAGGR